MIIKYDLNNGKIKELNPENIQLIDGIFSIKDEYITGLSKTILMDNEIKRQKRDKNGNLLYIEEVRDENGNILTKNITTDKISMLYKYSDKYISPIYYNDSMKNIPNGVLDIDDVRTEKNKPYMENVKDYKTISFIEHFTLFNIKEILVAKYEYLLEKSKCSNILAFSNEIEDIDIFNSNFHCCDLNGIRLEPNEYITLKIFEGLDKESNVFELLDIDEQLDVYINEIHFDSSKLILEEYINSIQIKIKNNTNRPATLKSLAIGHM